MTDLDARLTVLGEHLDVPAGDGLAAAVLARVMAPDRGSGWLRRRWRWLVAAVAVAVGGVGLSPAVADLLGVGGVAVHLSPAPTPSTISPTAPPPTMPPLDLGRPVALAAVPAAAGFAPILPVVLGPPDEVFVDDRGHVPIVWLRWENGPLLTQIEGGMPSMPVLQKFVGDGAEVRWVRAGGRPALWISGAHSIIVSEIDGQMVTQRLRTADSTLLLELRGVTVRIETTGGLEAATRVAASLGGT